MVALFELRGSMDKTLFPALIGALAGAIVSSLGWFVVHALSLRREVVARRDNAAREHVERQIEQLYGPLLGLIQHSRMAFAVAQKTLPINDGGQIDFSKFSDRHGEVWRYFVEDYFVPVNGKIRELIRSKMHLLEAGVLPKSFGEFLVHEVQLEALHRLWKEHGVDSSGIISGPGWPADFERETQAVLDELRVRHQHFLRHLGVSSAE